MNNDAGKHTRTWKKVVQYVVHLLAILVTFLPIVIITVLTLGWVSGETKLIIGIPDTIITVTTIILMYLIPFLLNARGFLQSLSKIKRNIREVSWPTSLKETFTESLKLAVYPVYFALRLAARFVLLLTILAAVLIPPIGISIVLGLALDWAWAKVAWTWEWAKVAWTKVAWTWEWAKVAWTWEWAKVAWTWEWAKVAWTWEWAKVAWTWTLDWNPELSESLIVTIITLFIIICLIPFLLRRYVEGIQKSLSNIKEKIGEVFQGTRLPGIDIGESLSVTWRCCVKRVWSSPKETFTESLKLAAYPVHLALCFATRFLLLLAILAAVLIQIIETILTTMIKAISRLSNRDLFPDRNITSEKNEENIWRSLEKIDKVFQGPWLPRMGIGESPSKTWRCNIKKAWQVMKEIFIESYKLVIAVLILCIILVYVYIQLKEPNKWQTEVMDKLKAIECKVDSIAIPDPKAWRDTVTTKLDDIRTDTAGLIILRSSGYSPAYLSEKGTRISLVYPPQGNLRSKRGICLEGDNLIWLKLFKKAFSAKCSNEEGRVRLKVQGFASIAPVTVNGDSMSNQLNCEIANERAEALIYFLKLADTIQYTTKGCKATLDDSLIWKGRAKSDSIWKAPGFDVTYKPWPSYAEMDSAKPAQDSRRPDLEFLNRTVQIIIEDGGCLTKPVDNAENSD